MLAKVHRLTTKEFEAVFTTGTHRHFPLFQRITTSENDSTKCAVVVGKKIFKNAVDRNRLRRQVYALLRECGYCERASGLHTIIICKKGAEQLDYQALKNALAPLLLS